MKLIQQLLSRVRFDLPKNLVIHSAIHSAIHSDFDERFSNYVFFGILILTAIVRFTLLDIPLERDEGEYAYAGQLILQGIPPYLEVFNMKFPGIYLVYALILSVFGETHSGIHLGLLLANLLTISFIYLLAKDLTNNVGAISAAGAYALLSVGIEVQGVMANAEHFVVLFALLGLLILNRGLQTEQYAPLFFAGLLLGLSVVTKQHGIFFSAMAFFYICSDYFTNDKPDWKRLVVRLSVFSSGAVLVFLLLCLIMLWQNVLSQFIFWTFDYASAYVSLVSLDQAWQLFNNRFEAIVLTAPLIWMFAALGLSSLFFNTGSKKVRIFLGLLFVFSALSICPGFYFRPHYFILLLPSVSLLFGYCMTVLYQLLSRYPSKGWQRLSLGLVLSLVLCQAIYNQRDLLFNLTSVEISRLIYGANPFPESLAVAEYLKIHTEPDDKIAILGSEPQIFFYAQRHSASGYIYMYPMMENHEYALKMQRAFIADIEAAEPKYVVFVGVSTSWLIRPDSHPDLLNWFNEYQQKAKLKLVGSVIIRQKESIYQWDENAVWPGNSPYTLSIFERRALSE